MHPDILSLLSIKMHLVVHFLSIRLAAQIQNWRCLPMQQIVYRLNADSNNLLRGYVIVENV